MKRPSSRRSGRSAAQAEGLVAQLEAIAANPLVTGKDEAAIRAGIAQLRAGKRPLLVLARIDPIIKRLTS